jgi:hypothetical protein
MGTFWVSGLGKVCAVSQQQGHAARRNITGLNEEDPMLGAAEFTMFGNILMGIMAIAGVCSLLYAFGASLANPSSVVEQGRLEEDTQGDIRKAA